MDKRSNKKYRDPDVILEYIESLIIDDEQYYIMLDEVQMLNEFEEVLNSLLHISNADIYVTGSNSKFLSKDVITEFRGRGDEIHIYPLTFKEFMEAYDGDMYHGWAEYVIHGGLPLTVTMKTEEQKIKYLTNLFAETYLKGIIERNNIEKTQELEDLINILASDMGLFTKPPKIQATFKSMIQSSISQNTIRQYIEYLEDVFLINKANRYNVKGRKYIGSPVKYYFEDVGVVEKRTTDETGKSVRKQLEIDFVANLGSKRYYIQSAFSIPTEEKRLQEKESLVNVTRDEDGITTMNIYDFLLISFDLIIIA